MADLEIDQVLADIARRKCTIARQDGTRFRKKKQQKEKLFSLNTVYIHFAVTRGFY